ncbi:MAG: 2-oxo acid dehydrogenase subunit E2 [Rhodospirillaceae bacterium]|nr:2-oxo acid dehydrogenase subunit E2 [Rhodospirillaceae bacterium]
MDIVVPVDQAEGTKFSLRSWLKPVGARVARDEAIAEVETDKVTMEIVAPTDGVISAQLVQKGAELQPGMKIGELGDSAVAPKAAPAPAPVAAKAAAPKIDMQSARNLRLSPLVRRLLAQNNVRAEDVRGTGRDGRITPADVLAHGTGRPTAPVAAASPAPAPRRTQGGSTMIPHTSMRRAIADHMARSVTIAPHVTAVFECDYSAVIADRKKYKAKGGLVPTFTAYFVAACVQAIQLVPKVNSRWHDDAIEVFDDINIGVGVSLGDGGLIVPVIHKAQDLSLIGIAQRLEDLTAKARNNQLTAADTSGGTFTISNHGVSGSLVASPIIINQPQSAILGVGKMEKRVVVRELNGSDAIVIAPMAFVSLTIDHRVLDGHQTNAFLTKWVEVMETWK